MLGFEYYETDLNNLTAEAGKLHFTVLGDMVTENYYTPDRGLPAGVSHSYGSNEFLSFEYAERDGSDRITRIVETKDSVTQETSYTYDPFGRLHQVFDGEGELQATYSYDENGNRTAYCKAGSPCIEGEYNAQDQLVQYGANTYTYTLKGELETRGGIDGITHYSYDPMGNLSQAVLPNNTVIGYTYDAQGRLIAKRVNGVIEYRLIYSGQVSPIAKVDSDGDVLELYISGTGANSPDYIVKAGSVYRVIKDHLGSTRMIVNANTGDIVKDIRYSEFGEITEETGTFNTIFGFAGGIRDTDTALTRFGARWYDPETGRWISKEPLGFNGSNNFYSYVDGDPVNKIDPSGLAEIYFLMNYVLSDKSNRMHWNSELLSIKLKAYELAEMGYSVQINYATTQMEMLTAFTDKETKLIYTTGHGDYRESMIGTVEPGKHLTSWGLKGIVSKNLKVVIMNHCYQGTMSKRKEWMENMPGVEFVAPINTTVSEESDVFVLETLLEYTNLIRPERSGAGSVSEINYPW